MFELYRLKLSQYKFYPWLIFISVTTATFMVNIDSSILTVALPILQDYFKTNLEVTQWVVTSYLLIITGILPTVGKLSDMWGRKRIFILGLFIFIVGSVLSALSVSILQLIIFRAIQGIGGSIMQGNVMSIVANTFSKGSRGTALGIIGSIVAIGTIVGPALGGFLIDSFDWQSIFWINVPIGIIGMMGSYILLPKDPVKIKQSKFDFSGAITFFIFMVSFMLYLSNAKTWGFQSTIAILLIIVAIIVFGFFIFSEMSTEHPLIDLSFFKIPIFTIGNLVGFLSFILIMFPSILLPLYLHNVLNLDIRSVGFIMAIQAIMMFIFAPIAGYLTDHVGYQIPSILGMVIASVSIVMFSQLGSHTSLLYIGSGIGLFGIGMGLFQSPNNISVLESVPIEKSGLTGSLIATVRNFGRSVGVSLATLLFTIHYIDLNTYSEAIQKAFLIAFYISLLGIVLTLTRSRIKAPDKSNA